MNIEKEIIYLLTINGKAVLAGFGSFTTEDIPSEIHPVHHTFSSPSKKINFCLEENNYDNTLVNHLSATYNTPKAETINIINNYINDITNNIEKSGRHVFEGFGILSKNQDGVFDFQLNADINVSGESFGMEDFTSQAVKREKTTPPESAPVKKRSKAWLVVLIIFLVLAAGSVTAYFVFPEHVNKGVAFVEAQYHSIKDKIFSKNKAVAENTNKDNKDNKDDSKKDKKNKNLNNILEKAMNDVVDSLGDAVKTDTLQNVNNNQKVKEEKKNNVATDNISTPSGKMYYIVAGSFKSKENAEKYVSELKTKGYAKACILANTQNGFYTVAYDAYADKSTASQELKRINDKEQKGSWLSYQ